MLNKTLTHTKDYLEWYFESNKVLGATTQAPISIAIDSPEKEGNQSARLLVSLWRIEPETLARAFEPIPQSEESKPTPGTRPKAAELRLNLYVLVSANPNAGVSYPIALQDISNVITAFQQQRTFSVDAKKDSENNTGDTQNNDSTSSQDNDSELCKLKADSGLVFLSYEMQSLSSEQHNSLWQTLGSKMMPCVVYKIRTVAIQVIKNTDNIGFIQRAEKKNEIKAPFTVNELKKDNK